jgi:spermidine/putrescine transport system permease protein
VAERAHRAGLVTPTLLVWVALFAAPLILIGVYSFGQMNPITFTMTFGWTTDNYRTLTSDLYIHTILRSLFVSLTSTLLCLLIGFPVAYYLSLQRGARQAVMLIMVLLPFWCSFIVRTYAWIDILRNGGPLERVLNSTGLHSGSLDVLYSPTSIAIGMVYNYLPLMIVPLFVALERIDLPLVEAASDLGAPRRHKLTRVIIPLAMPGIVAGCILVGVPALGEYVIPAILGGNKTLMFGNVVADQFLSIGDYPFGSALATVFMIGVTMVLIVTRRATADIEDVV